MSLADAALTSRILLKKARSSKLDSREVQGVTASQPSQLGPRLPTRHSLVLLYLAPVEAAIVSRSILDITDGARGSASGNGDDVRYRVAASPPWLRRPKLLCGLPDKKR